MIFVSGGVRSGKSKKAEELVQRSEGERHVYIATSRITDDEMRERVNLHQKARRDAARPWVTIEQANNFHELVPKLKKTDVVLVDCATNWMANELFIDAQSWEDHQFCQSILEKMKQDLLAITSCVKEVVVVSNELFEGDVPDEATEVYMRLLGSFHQFLVEESSTAGVMEYGLFKVKKEAIVL
ncbi:bifunctional adenosylcobinamide kinase/adenosylcobinamide-phosphate guanylyltransferase [Priestia koreensis]|uniref:bifunctional adenosylcobinamide kinase/adenosylcobinamide-phosphate guanylyltransferase n=1 Tax=Priestia koreensis TaxID=284581 RepID=UPI003D0802B8